MRTLLTVTLAAVLLLVAAPAGAETQLLEAQKQLNAESAKAAAAGEYDKAALLLRSSLELGELNITWLNLGRVLFKGNRCAEARTAYQKALTAPAAPNPPAEVVQATAAEFLAELSTACAGTLALECPLAYEVYVNGEAAQCGGRLDLAAGEHEVRARHEGWEVTQTVTVVGVETTSVNVDVRSGRLVPSPEPFPEPRPDDPAGEPQYLAWSTIGAGVVVIAGAGLYRWSYQDDIDEIEALSATIGGDRSRYDALADSIPRDDAITWTLLAVGVATTSVGVGILLAGGDEEGSVQVVPNGLLVRY